MKLTMRNTTACIEVPNHDDAERRADGQYRKYLECDNGSRIVHQMFGAGSP